MMNLTDVSLIGDWTEQVSTHGFHLSWCNIIHTLCIDKKLRELEVCRDRPFRPYDCNVDLRHYIECPVCGLNKSDVPPWLWFTPWHVDDVKNDKFRPNTYNSDNLRYTCIWCADSGCELCRGVIKRIKRKWRSRDKPQRKRMSISVRKRFKILERDKFRCVYCGRSPVDDIDVKLVIDHKLPLAKGGDYSFNNLVAACVECNAGKASDVIKDDDEDE